MASIGPILWMNCMPVLSLATEDDYYYDFKLTFTTNMGWLIRGMGKSNRSTCVDVHVLIGECTHNQLSDVFAKLTIPNGIVPMSLGLT